jgi:hypothetical protein
MLTRDGMRDALGLATFEAPRHALFLHVPTGAPCEDSADTARGSDAAIQTLLEAAHTRVWVTLTAQRTLLEALGQRLRVQAVVARNALLRLLGTAGCKAPSETPGSPGGPAETGVAAERRVMPPYTGAHTCAGAAWP